VGEHEWQGIGVGRPDVEEVDPEPVDLGAELGERVQPGLGGPPVILLRPGAAEFLEVREGNTLRPVIDGLGLGPTRSPEPLAQVTQVILVDLDPERIDLTRRWTLHRVTYASTR
jgi:hypothetical protein